MKWFLLLLLAVPVRACDVLIKAQNATNVDPIKDARGCYKRGDIVAVGPDNSNWGACQFPAFVVLKIPTLSLETAQKLIRMQWDNTDPDNPISVKRRVWYLDIDAVVISALPTAIKISIRDNGFATVTPAQVKPYVKNKETGETL
jgi:hypothetical protein